MKQTNSTINEANKLNKSAAFEVQQVPKKKIYVDKHILQVQLSRNKTYEDYHIYTANKVN